MTAKVYIGNIYNIGVSYPALGGMAFLAGLSYTVGALF